MFWEGNPSLISYTQKIRACYTSELYEQAEATNFKSAYILVAIAVPVTVLQNHEALFRKRNSFIQTISFRMFCH